MRDYDSWSFWNRPFLIAITASLAWHFLWFFSITIVVSPHSKLAKDRPVIVSLGPVLDDSIFKTLLETRPEVSQTFYRRVSDFSSAVDVEAETVQRFETGDVVSLPFGRRFLSSVKDLIGGSKASPDYDFVSRIPIAYPAENFSVEGELQHRAILNRPEPPDDEDGQGTPFAEYELAVESSGKVKSVEIVTSSGNPSFDSKWVQYLERWQFAPLETGRASLDEHGRVRVGERGR